MKNLMITSIVSILLFGCSEGQNQINNQTDPMNLKLDGFWMLSKSQFFEENVSSQDCPITEFYSEPDALGSHILFEGDRISFFRYPYQYYGTFKIEIRGDSIYIMGDRPIYSNKFLVYQTAEDVLILNFEEAFTSTCILPGKAEYEFFTPDAAIINKLIKDSISFDPLIDKWWYLRKEISYEDGMDPLVLNYPKGMPDSIFVSKEMINRNNYRPSIDFKLNNRVVKMYFQNPDAYSFSLAPEFEKDEILFSYLVDYGECQDADTIYFDVIYHK